MSHKDEKKRTKTLAVGKPKLTAKQIVGILDKEFEKFKTLTEKTKLRNVYNWTKDIANVPQNWIDQHQARYRKPPKIPERIGVLIENYSSGMRVSKKLKLKKAPPSMQYWQQELLPNERKKFLELVQWLGHDSEDYEEMIKRSIPGSPSDIRVHWKR
jgi:hypothetical protein